MSRHPVVIRLMCVALVAVIVAPIGRALFPFVGGEIGALPFDTVEAVVSATLGFGLYALMFG
jgi:hypothetical protein